MNKNPHYYLINVHTRFNTLSLDCVDELYKIVKRDIENDVIFLHKLLKYLSYPSDFNDIIFNDFIDIVLNSINYDSELLKSQKNKIFERVLSETNSFIDCCRILVSKYYFCINDIADYFKCNESFKYILKQEFKDKKMWHDSFDKNITEINIDELEW